MDDVLLLVSIRDNYYKVCCVERNLICKYQNYIGCYGNLVAHEGLHI